MVAYSCWEIHGRMRSGKPDYDNNNDSFNGIFEPSGLTSLPLRKRARERLAQRRVWFASDLSSDIKQQPMISTIYGEQDNSLIRCGCLTQAVGLPSMGRLVTGGRSTGRLDDIIVTSMFWVWHYAFEKEKSTLVGSYLLTARLIGRNRLFRRRGVTNKVAGSY